MAFIPALATAAATAYSTWQSHRDQKKAQKGLKFENYTHSQKKLLDEMAKHSYVHLPNITKDKNYLAGTQYLQKIISQDPELMKQFSAPYEREFNEQTVPRLAEQFGGIGAQDSSGFAQSLGAAGAGLQERLAALRSELGMQAANQLYGYSQLPGQQRAQEQALTLQQRNAVLGASPYTYGFQEGSPGAGYGLGQALPGLAAKHGTDVWGWLKGFSGGGSSTPSSISWGSNNLG